MYTRVHLLTTYFQSYDRYKNELGKKTRFPFDKETINCIPQFTEGVYFLYQDDECIYIGSSDTSIYERLRKHISGEEGPCTAAAHKFAFEANSPYPEQIETLYLLGFQGKHGRLPRCNDKVT